LQKQWLSGDRAFLLILLENPGPHRSRERCFTLAFTGGDAFGNPPRVKMPGIVLGLTRSATYELDAGADEAAKVPS
jgi:hypothetical protein